MPFERRICLIAILFVACTFFAERTKHSKVTECEYPVLQNCGFHYGLFGSIVFTILTYLISLFNFRRKFISRFFFFINSGLVYVSLNAYITAPWHKLEPHSYSLLFAVTLTLCTALFLAYPCNLHYMAAAIEPALKTRTWVQIPLRGKK